MGYRTILKYTCDMCNKEEVFKEMDKGPLFNQKGWTNTDVSYYTYESYPYDHHIRNLYCPECTDKYGVNELMIHTIRSK